VLITIFTLVAAAPQIARAEVDPIPPLAPDGT